MRTHHKKFERLLLFAEVASVLSFSQAAKNLGISRGHLSDQIKTLESELGAPLFIRSTRSVKLTKEGENALCSMDQVRATLLTLERSLHHDHGAIEGDVRITSPTLFTHRFLIDICAEFRALHPKINFHIDSSYTNFNLMQSNFDLAFRATNTPPENMVAKALLAYQHICCAAPSYLSAHGMPSQPEALVDHQCLRAPDQPNWEFGEKRIAVAGWVTLNDNLLLKQQALAGNGIVRLPSYVVEDDIQQGLLAAILENESASDQTIFILHPQLVLQSARIKAFVQFTQQWFTVHNSAKN